jgi:hypothetical protein
VNVIVGQEVAVQTSYSTLFGFVVTKVTPSGQVVAARPGDDTAITKRFDANGYGMGAGSSKFHCDRLVTDVAAAREAVRKENALRAAARAICAVQAERGCNPRWGTEYMLKELDRLETLVAKARELVAAVDVGGQT